MLIVKKKEKLKSSLQMTECPTTFDQSAIHATYLFSGGCMRPETGPGIKTEKQKFSLFYPENDFFEVCELIWSYLKWENKSISIIFKIEVYKEPFDHKNYKSRDQTSKE